jgi:hypothetical protein
MQGQSSFHSNEIIAWAASFPQPFSVVVFAALREARLVAGSLAKLRECGVE